MIKTVRMIISGRVQGVGFRWAAKQVADELGITGYVINLIDGTVKIIAQAHPLAMTRFIAAMKKSPTPYGHVSHVNVEPITGRNYKFFSVK